MHTTITLQPLIDEMGMDIYDAYDDDKKRMIEPAVILGFCIMLFEEFLKGFFDFEKLGQKLRQQFENLFSAGKSATQKSALEYEQELTALVEHIIANTDLKKKNGKREATAKIEGFLIAKKIPVERATELSRSIADIIEKQLKL